MKRVLSFLMSLVLVFFLALDCTPVASAVAPLALMQAAVASYLASSGYSMYQSNGVASSLLGAVGNLYDAWCNTLTGQLASVATLTHLAAIDAVYLDNQSNIVITKEAADIFAQFASWVQTHNSVPEDGTHTNVILPSASSVSDGNGFSAAVFTGYTSYPEWGGFNQSPVIGTCEGNSVFIVANATWDAVYAFNYRENNSWTLVFMLPPLQRVSVRAFLCKDQNGGQIGWTDSWKHAWIGIGNKYVDGLPEVTLSTLPSPDSVLGLTVNAGSGGLAVSLGSAVVDIASRAGADDALVIDVGATAGDTASEVAGIVGSGAIAGTLNPSVSVTAEAVIDTPVQQYPDFDSLGLPELGLALVERFPFCIPYDFVHLISLFDAEPVAPYIEIDLIPASLKQRIGLTASTTFTLDFTSGTYQTMGTIIRWGSLVGFCLGLLLLTRKLIWTS